MISPGQVFAPAPGVEAARFSGEKVVLDPAGRMLRGLNATGARVWELLDGRRTVLEVAHALAAESGVNPTRALSDVSAFLQHLLDRRLIAPAKVA